MPVDFDSLDGHQFELLCAALVAAEGYTHLQKVGRIGTAHHGVDFVCVDPTGARTAVEASAYRPPCISLSFDVPSRTFAMVFYLLAQIGRS